MPFTFDSVKNFFSFIPTPEQYDIDVEKYSEKVADFEKAKRKFKVVEKSDEPEIVGITTLKVRTNEHYTYTWTVGHYDDVSTTPDVFRDFTEWYNSPRPDQVASHYIMRYSKGETMVRRADIISYELRYEEQ